MAKYYKQLTTYLLAFTISLFLFISCQEGGEAGDLWGQWRMTGSDTQYISFSGSITLLQSTTEGEVFGNFQHQGDSLFIQCYSIEGIPSDTTLVEQSFGFKSFNNIRLKITKLTSDHLELSNGSQTWSFYQY